MDSILKEATASTQHSNEKTFIIRQAAKDEQHSPASALTTRSIQSSSHLTIVGHDDALRVLQNEPDLDSLLTTLEWLTSTTGRQSLDLSLPGPSQAKIVRVLVESILPSCWQVLSGTGRRALVECLTSITGLKALAASSRRYLSQRVKEGPIDRTIIDQLEVLDMMVRPRDIFSKLWSGLQALLPDETKLDLAWKEVVNFFGSRVLDGIQHEAASKLGRQSLTTLDVITSADWFSSNVLHLASASRSPHGTREIVAASKLLAKSFEPNYAQRSSVLLIARDCLSSVGDDDMSFNNILTALIAPMQKSDKRRCIETLLSCLSTNQDMTAVPSLGTSGTWALPGTARLLHILSQKDGDIRQDLAKTIIDMNHAPRTSFVVRQAALLAMSNTQPNELPTLLTKAISTFGDRLFIDHGLLVQQEAIAQLVILSVSYLHRKHSALVTTALRSGNFMQGISNRLAASGSRARWLGMIVSTAVSRLVDKPDMQMKFGTSDMETPEAKRWLDLIHADDRIGKSQDAVMVIESTIRPPQVLEQEKKHPKRSTLPVINGKQSFGPPRPPALVQTEVQGDKVTEVLDAPDDTDEDLKPYAKPDSDPEDSDEDATLVNRDKAKPPVYIRTLMVMLRDNEKADRFQLAVKHAAPLIRRKTGFGREVSDHAEELARILSNLQDPFETEGFEDLRLQALIALVLSDVFVVAPWLACQAFAKDYSIAQRSIMLTALGLSGRELAGYKQEDELNRSLDQATFPSKQLPRSLDSLYSSKAQTHMLERASRQVEQAIIQPLALTAADQTTSHLDAVKVRRFSSRLDNGRTKRRPTTNELAKVFNHAYFQPLLGSAQHEITAFGDSSIYFSMPMLLATFLKTIAILLHASGPATSGLTHVTADLWELLLHLRVRAAGDILLMEAVLFALLTLLEVNGNKQEVVRNNPKQLMETKQWAEMVFERTGGGALIEGEGEEARIRTLCAGVLTKASDIISSYQKTLMGTLSDF